MLKKILSTWLALMYTATFRLIPFVQISNNTNVLNVFSAAWWHQRLEFINIFILRKEILGHFSQKNSRYYYFPHSYPYLERPPRFLREISNTSKSMTNRRSGEKQSCRRIAHNISDSHNIQTSFYVDFVTTHIALSTWNWYTTLIKSVKRRTPNVASCANWTWIIFGNIYSECLPPPTEDLCHCHLYNLSVFESDRKF